MENSKIILSSVLVMVAITSIVILAKNLEQNTKFSGEELYRINCASCHGIDRSGNPPHYPSLINIKDKLSKDEIQKQIENGKNLMPAFPHLTLQEKNVIIAFLFDEKTQTVEVSSKDFGEKIFKSNCSSCHRATVNDPKPTNIRMMEPAPLAGATKRFTKDEFFKILETGVCYMPSFEHFISSEKEALYFFIKSLEGKGEPARPTMGEMCPMMMRMRKGNQ
jgi:mono/diheme cytochrome c family protein